jgi:hypothetical protein
LVQRPVKAAMFDRGAFQDAFFDDDATADAALIVAGVGAITYLVMVMVHGRVFSLTGLLQEVILGVISWLILAIATWFAATRLFRAGVSPQMVMALHGLAVLPLVLGVAPGRVIPALGLVWYLALLVVATREATSIATRDAAVSVLIGFAVAALVRLLFRAPFLVLGQLF